MLMIAVAIAATGAPVSTDPVIPRLIALFDEACLQTFPTDGGLDSLMAAKGATALTTEQVQKTFRGDPGRGWLLKDGSDTIQVMLELPPFHACSVRRMTVAGLDNLDAYRRLVDPYEAAHPTFAPVAVYETDFGNIHVYAVGEQRTLPGGGTEALFVFDQHITDAKRRAAGETGVEVRFVRQIHIAP